MKSTSQVTSGAAQESADTDKSSADQVNKDMLEVAKRESLRTEDDIYEEVFIDECNQEILKNVLKQDGEIIVVLMR